MSCPGVKYVICDVCGARFETEQAEWFPVDDERALYTAACPSCVQQSANKAVGEELEALLGCLRDLAEDGEDSRAARAAELLETFEHRSAAAAKAAAAPPN